jgi:hypothetical protein
VERVSRSPVERERKIKWMHQEKFKKKTKVSSFISANRYKLEGRKHTGINFFKKEKVNALVIRAAGGQCLWSSNRL